MVMMKKIINNLKFKDLYKEIYQIKKYIKLKFEK